MFQYKYIHIHDGHHIKVNNALHSMCWSAVSYSSYIHEINYIKWTDNKYKKGKALKNALSFLQSKGQFTLIMPILKIPIWKLTYCIDGSMVFF